MLILTIIMMLITATLGIYFGGLWLINSYCKNDEFKGYCVGWCLGATSLALWVLVSNGQH